MAVVFSLRGDSLDTRYTKSFKSANTHYTNLAPGVVADAATGVIGGNTIDISGADSRAISYCAKNIINTGNKMSLLLRFQPDWEGTPGGFKEFFSLMALNPVIPFSLLSCYSNSNGTLVITHGDENKNQTNASTSVLSLTQNKVYDLLFVFNGDITTGRIKVYLDGVEVGSSDIVTPTINTWSGVNCLTIGACHHVLSQVSGLKINEFVIWDEVINQVSYTGETRTEFVTVSQIEGAYSTDPLIENVKSPTEYYINGIQKTGSLIVTENTDPGFGNVREGVTYIHDDVELSGALKTLKPEQDPLFAHVLIDKTYGIMDEKERCNDEIFGIISDNNGLIGIIREG